MSKSPASHRHSTLWVACGALLISFSPIFVKNVVPDPIGPTACGFWRTALGTFALAAWACARRESLRMPRGAVGLAVLAGVVFSLDIGTWHHAIMLMPRAGAGLATVLANTQVIWVALVGALILHEGGGWRLAAAVVCALGGVAVMVGVITPEGIPRAPLSGLLLGLATGVCYATFILVLRRAQRAAPASAPGAPAPPSAVVFMTWTSAACALATGLGTLVLGESWVPRGASAWLSIAGLAVVVQAFAWVVLTRHLRHVPAAVGALLLLLQPTFAMVWGVLLHDEAFTAYELGGAALLLAGIYMGSTTRRVKTQ